MLNSYRIFLENLGSVEQSDELDEVEKWNFIRNFHVLSQVSAVSA